MKILTLLFALFSQSLFGGTPTEALTAFLNAAKAQNFDETWKHTAQFEGASEEVTQYLQSRIQRLLKPGAEGKYFKILEEKISGDCAVLVLDESTVTKPFDLDPAFLIKQGAEWKVMPDITKWDLTERIPAENQPASMKLDETRVTDFKKLEMWFKERKAILRDERKRAK